jgi:hypothetical protein
MIPKSQEKVETESQDSGRPFYIPPRGPIEKNDAERQRPQIIHLGDLNGQSGGRGMPVSFEKRSMRHVASFERYWSQAELDEDNEEAFDIL